MASVWHVEGPRFSSWHLQLKSLWKQTLGKNFLCLRPWESSCLAGLDSAELDGSISIAPFKQGSYKLNHRVYQVRGLFPLS